MKRSEMIDYFVHRLDQEFGQKSWMWEIPLEEVVENKIINKFEQHFDFEWEPEEEE